MANDSPLHEALRYKPTDIETRWQQRWQDEGTYEIVNHDPRDREHLPGVYSYPSDAADQGCVRSYTFGDLLARYRTMQGSGVSAPTDFDTFGFSAEHVSSNDGRSPGRSDDIHGADALRLAHLQLKSPSGNLDWGNMSLDGCSRFLGRVWRLARTETARIPNLRSGPTTAADHEVDVTTHHFIARITDAYERPSYHIAVAGFMEFTSGLYKYVQSRGGSHDMTVGFAIDSLLLVMAPAVPHITAELWEHRHPGEHIHARPWPKADAAKLVAERVTMIVQVNGKVRARIEVDAAVSDHDATARALASANVRTHLGGADPRKVIVRAPKLINVVT